MNGRTAAFASRSSAGTPARPQNRTGTKPRRDIQPLHELAHLRAYPSPFAAQDASAAISSSLRHDPTDTSHRARQRVAALDTDERADAIAGAEQQLDVTERDQLGTALADESLPQETVVADETAPHAEPGVQPSSALDGSRLSDRTGATSSTGAAATGSAPATSPTSVGASQETPTSGQLTTSAPEGPAVPSSSRRAEASAPAAESGVELPRLIDLLQPADSAPTAAFESPGAAGPVDAGALVTELARAATVAERDVQQQAYGACRRLNRQVGAARAAVGDEKTLADNRVKEIVAKRLAELNTTLALTESNVDHYKRLRLREAADHAKTVKSDLSDTFKTGRDLLEFKKLEALGQVHRVKTAETNLLHNTIGPMAYDVYMLGYHNWKLKAKTDRGRVIGNAIYDVGETAYKEFKKSERESVAAVESLTQQMADKVNEGAQKAYAELAKGPPPLLLSVDLQVLPAAQRDIDKKAAEAHRVLEGPAEAMRTRLTTLEGEACARNTAGAAHVCAELERGRKQAERALIDVVPAVMEPIRSVIVDACTILTSADALDPTRSRQFVDEMLTFARGGTEEAAAVFDETVTAASAPLSAVRPTARRGFRRVQRDLSATLRAEATVTGGLLLAFELEADTQFGQSITDIDDAGRQADLDLNQTLESSIMGFGQQLIKAIHESWRKLRDGVMEGLREQSKAKDEVRGAMQEAAINAAFKYDHPILSRAVTVLGWVLGLIIAIVAIIFGFELIIAGIMLFGVSQAVATVAAIVIGIGFLLHQAYSSYTSRREAGQSVGAALLGTLADVTGITSLRRSLTDSSLSPFERGLEFGFGIGSIVAPFLSRTRVVRRISARLKPRILDPRAPGPTLDVQLGAVQPVAVRLPAAQEAPASIAPPKAVEAPGGPRTAEAAPMARSDFGDPIARGPEMPAPRTTPQRAQAARDADVAVNKSTTAQRDLEPHRPEPQTVPRAPAPEPEFPAGPGAQAERAPVGEAHIPITRARKWQAAEAKRRAEAAQRDAEAAKAREPESPAPERTAETAREPKVGESNVASRAAGELSEFEIAMARRDADLQAARQAADQARVRRTVKVKRAANGTLVEEVSDVPFTATPVTQPGPIVATRGKVSGPGGPQVGRVNAGSGGRGGPGGTVIRLPTPRGPAGPAAPPPARAAQPVAKKAAATKGSRNKPQSPFRSMTDDEWNAALADWSKSFKPTGRGRSTLGGKAPPLTAKEMEGLLKAASSELSAERRAGTFPRDAPPSVVGTRLHALIAAKGGGRVQGWQVMVETPLSQWPRTLPQSVLNQTVRQYLAGRHDLAWLRLKLPRKTLNTRVGDLKPDRGLLGPNGEVMIWDLTRSPKSSYAQPHLAKTALYGHLFERMGKLFSFGETYWGWKNPQANLTWVGGQVKTRVQPKKKGRK